MTPEKPRNTPEPGEPTPALAEDLKALFRADRPVPTQVDEAILRSARVRLIRRQTRPWLRLGISGAAAAAMLLVVWWNQTAAPPPPERLAHRSDSVGGASLREEEAAPAADPPQLDPQDIDGSGRVTILDAYALKRRIEMGNALAHHDVNGDGAVDDLDVDRVARRAVQLR